ncbi:hypothetical protein K435DRAFT_405024 [Dendrothele bispora CBS 962.96]|uniref:Uncharacterized protein n=1 Tax=Dendrothele bispora (strain CBS 962.96) TaxID=1314807 RepID=A0A4S8L870_DENBC|nr:hypothetical protein K435DRAFT_405024 [Dendrothele bispora CBS 962.96]
MLTRCRAGMVIVSNKYFLENVGYRTLVGRMASCWENEARKLRYSPWVTSMDITNQSVHLPGVPGRNVRAELSSLVARPSVRVSYESSFQLRPWWLKQYFNANIIPQREDLNYNAVFPALPVQPKPIQPKPTPQPKSVQPKPIQSKSIQPKPIQPMPVQSYQNTPPKPKPTSKPKIQQHYGTLKRSSVSSSKEVSKPTRLSSLEPTGDGPLVFRLTIKTSGSGKANGVTNKDTTASGPKSVGGKAQRTTNGNQGDKKKRRL